ncbi:hypothetical protein MSG28_002141 [Choristoneura fumiferana]|uniref:Uncharacterized protein n=1 Tax=Choristoneura fumiferana TaxID=7141 RepID=A0ACC0JUA8_CHOFU|nr:hypothetical protein MSG28_002141 [Choristoneura fumiferana]
MVDLGTNILDKNRPRYLMGVGVAIDLVVCVALGVDMFDCVFPTRTARFGCALVNKGQLNLKQKQYETDLNPIDVDCTCSTCANYTRAYLHCIVTVETVACHLISVHNIAYQMRLMRKMRKNIEDGTFPQFVKSFVKEVYPDSDYPTWVVNSLSSVGIDIKTLDRLGFTDYTIEAEAVLKDCKAVAAKRRRQSTRLENLGIPEEELLRQQQELFAKVDCEDGPELKPIAIMFPDLLEKDPQTLQGMLTKSMSTTEVTKHLVDLGQKANFTFMKKANRLIPPDKVSFCIYECNGVT